MCESKLLVVPEVIPALWRIGSVVQSLYILQYGKLFTAKIGDANEHFNETISIWNFQGTGMQLLYAPVIRIKLFANWSG